METTRAQRVNDARFDAEQTMFYADHLDAIAKRYPAIPELQRVAKEAAAEAIEAAKRLYFQR